MASRSVICRSRRLRQIIDVRDTGKSRYFAITEFNNCFIIRSPSLFFNEYLREAKRSAFFHSRTSTHEQNIICSQTQLDNIAHAQTIICRQLFAGHVVGFRPMKRKKILHRMIIYLTRAWVNIAFPCRKRGSKSATVFSAISRSGIGASPCSPLLASATCFWTLAVRSPVWVTTVYWNEKIITIIIKIIIWLQDWGHYIPMIWPSFLKRV